MTRLLLIRQCQRCIDESSGGQAGVAAFNKSPRADVALRETVEWHCRASCSLLVPSSLILIPLLVASLILGSYPKRALLVAAGLDDQFGPLLERLRLGDGAGMLRELDRWREWHRAHGNYLLMRERLQVGAWRNLMRRW